MTPLKNNWLKIYTPLVQHIKLKVKMNIKKKAVELKVIIINKWKKKDY